MQTLDGPDVVSVHEQELTDQITKLKAKIDAQDIDLISLKMTIN